MINRTSLPSIIIITLTAAYLAITFIPICEPATLWGISHLYYLSWPARVAVLAGGLLTAVLAITFGNLSKLSRPAKNTLVYFVLPLALLAIFYLLRVKTHYLGDGILRAREIELGIALLPTEPLGHFCNYLWHSIFSALLGWNSIQSIAALSLLSGVVFYFAVLYLVKTLFENSEDQTAAFIVLLFSGTTLLFCGYVESYSLLPALITFYAASSIRALENRGPASVPIRLFFVLVLFHFQFLYLAPTLLYIAYQQFRKGATATMTTGLFSILFSLAAVIVIPIWAGRPALGIKEFLIDFTSNNVYWLLSRQHLLDILNQLLLTAVVPVAMIAALFRPIKNQLSATQPRLLFAGLLLPGAMAFMTLLRPELGYASDWDLFSSAGLAIGIFAITLFSVREGINLSRPARAMMSMAAVVSFLSFAAVNADVDKALARQIDILTIAGEKGAVGFETLGTDLSKSGRDDLAEQMWKRSAEVRPNARVLGNLGQVALGQQRFAEAEAYLKQALALDSTRALFTLDLGLTYVWQGRYDLGEFYLRKAATLAPYEAKYHHNLALFLSRHGNLAEAESCSRRAVELEPTDANYATALGTMLSMQGNNVEAERFLLQAIRSRPDFANASINLAAVYRSIGQVERAGQILTEYLARFPENPESARVRQALSELRK